VNVTGFAIRRAAHCIRRGGVIVYPTETVYGLGCDPLNAEAVSRINRIKQRPPGKGLIIAAPARAVFLDANWSRLTLKPA